jgi:putative phosphoesterase
VAGVRELLPSERVLQVQGKRVALIHGWGSPAGIEDRVRDRFRGVDVILYGHTHQAASLWLKGVLMLNPGSATGTFPATCKSYGILTISDTVSADIVRLEENVTSPVGHSADGVASYTTPR